MAARLWTLLALGLVMGCDADGDKDGASGDDGNIQDEGGVGGGSDGGSGADGSDGGDGGVGGDGADGEDGGDGGDGGGTSGSGDGIEPEPAPPPTAPDDVECGDTISLQAQVLDGSGRCTDDCDGEWIWMAGVAYNPCLFDLEVTLTSESVIGSVSASNSDTGEGFGSSGGSTGEVYTISLPPGEYIVHTEYLGTLSRGHWSGELVFSDAASTRSPLEFVVH